HERNKERRKSQIEERRANRNLVAGQRFKGQRIKRADKHSKTSGRKKKVIENQCALTRNRREQAALFEKGRAPGEQRKPSTDENDENSENEHASRRIVGESMHGCEYTRSHEKCTDERKRERQYGKQYRPNFQCVAFLHNNGRMQKRSAGQPRHQRCVFNRIPKPET